MNNFVRYFVVALIVGVSITPALAKGNCDISIRAVGETRVNNYNALSREINLEPIRLRLTNNGDSDCVGEIIFQRTDGDGRLIGPRNTALDYLIVNERDISSLLFDPETARQNRMPVQVRAGQTIEARPRLFVRRGQAGISGLYRATIEAIFSPAGRTGSEAATVQLAASVIPSVQANFVGVSRSSGHDGASLVDLGEIKPGMRRSLGLQIRANTDVDVEVSSEHGGRLVQRGRDGGSIGYRMNVAGSSVNLGAQADIALPAGVERTGRTSQISIQIENFDDAPAGQYGDTILFRISAR